MMTKKDDVLTDKPSTPYNGEAKKRTRREKDTIVIDKLKAFYGDVEEEEVKTALTTAIEAVKSLHALAKKHKKKRGFSIKKMARFRTKEEIQQMIIQLQEVIKTK